jgi:RNA polymerase sigma-70 factor, ECF subfamily
VAITTKSNLDQLVSSAQNGDRNAFSELVRIHSLGVRNVVYRVCGNRQMAEDAAQEAFIRAWTKLSSYSPKVSFKSWLYRIAVNAALDMLRKEKRILPNALEDLKLRDINPTPEAMLASTERADLIAKALSSLSDASRTVLILREYEELSYNEIAETLEIPMGTVMSRLSYARKLLKEKLAVALFASAEDKNG